MRQYKFFRQESGGHYRWDNYGSGLGSPGVTWGDESPQEAADIIRRLYPEATVKIINHVADNPNTVLLLARP